MMASTTRQSPYSRIIGTGSYLPPKRVTNDELATQLAARGLETSDEWIVARTGIRARHFAEADMTTTDLALIASQRAIEAAGIDVGSIDLIIVATSTPDFVFPSSACLLQSKLGIKNGCAAFDVQAVCSGFAYALATADNFIRSGANRTALVVGAETFSRILDFNDRTTCVLFGDGAGAVVLQASDEPGVLSTALHADGSHASILCVPGNVHSGAIAGNAFLHMDGQAVFKLAVNVLEKVANEALEKAGKYPDHDQHRAQARSACRTHGGHRGSAWQYLGRVDSACARCCRARWPHYEGAARAARRRGRRLHLGRRARAHVMVRAPRRHAVPRTTCEQRVMAGGTPEPIRVAPACSCLTRSLDPVA
jgi:3-oxoacyl-[acyl-carrier-protein] synthase-3